MWTGLYIFVVFHGPEPAIAYFCALLWGLVSLLIVFNIGHDAVHEVVSKRKWVNHLLKYSFNLVGGNAYSWKLKHNLAHHQNTNIEGLDFDTDLSPLIRLSPQSPYHPLYRWQHYTFLLIYPLLSLLIIFVGDIKIFNQMRQSGQTDQHPKREWVILGLSKVWYFTLVFVLPMIYSPYTPGQIIVTFLCFHLVNGIVIALVFMPSHYFNSTSYYSERPQPYNWTLHQMSTTMDLSPHNRPLSQLLGCLNLNVAHHLYPNFCHNHYPPLSLLIQKNARQYHVNYHEMPYPRAVLEHVRFLKKLGTRDA